MPAPRLPNELSWPKLFGTALAAVTTAWLAGYFGLGNTLTGAAIGSLVATMATAVFTSTINRGSTMLIRTESGTIVQKSVDDSGNAVDEGELQIGADHPGAYAETEVVPAVEADQPWWKRLHWPAIAVATLITLAITLLGITMYEEAVGKTWGSNEPGTTLGHTFERGPQPSAAPTVTPTSTPTPTKTPTKTPTPTPTVTTSPTPTSATTTPEPTSTPTSAPTETPTPTPSPTDTVIPPG